MAKNISLMGADYPDVPAVQLPQTGGGTATFYDINVIDNLNSDSSTDALSAKQGKELNNNIAKLIGVGSGNGPFFANKDSGSNILILRLGYNNNSDFLQLVINSNDKTIKLNRKVGSGSEITLATWTGT